MTNNGGKPGMLHALTHYAMSPLFMTRIQPEGTAGRDAVFEGGATIWPEAVDMHTRAQEQVKRGMVLDAAAARTAFLPVYRAWKESADRPLRLHGGSWTEAVMKRAWVRWP
jgi:hypothetical protein